MNLADKFVMYVGNKAEKRDTVTGSNLYWPGNGSILAVEHTTAVQLIRHPDVWVEVDDEGKRIVKAAPIKKAVSKKIEPVVPVVDVDPTAPTVEEVITVILGLDQENPDHFTEAGKPKQRAVSGVLGVDVETKLLNAAWKEING